AQHSFARRGLLHFGNHCRLLLRSAFLQGAGKAAYRIGLAGRGLDFGEADTRTTLGHLTRLAGENLIQHGWHAHPSFSTRNTEVKETSSSSFSQAKPMCRASCARCMPSLRVEARSAAYSAAPALSTIMSAAFWPFSVLRLPNASRIRASESSAPSMVRPIRL